MGKKENPPIRWLKRDNKKLAREVKRVNAKIDRLNKKGYDIQKISVRAIKQDVKTRKELNTLLKQVDKFAKRGSEKKTSPNEIFAFEKTYVGLRHRTNEERKAKELEELNKKPVTSRGKDTGLKRGEMSNKQMGSVKKNSLLPKEFNPKDRKEFNKFAKNLEFHLDKRKMKQYAEMLKENYLKGLIREGYSDELQKMICFIDLEDIIDTINSDTEATIEFIYDPNQLEVKEEALKEVWEKAFIDNKERFIDDLERKGIDYDTANAIRDLDTDEFLNEFVGDFSFNEYIDSNNLQNFHIDYNILKDKKLINSKFKK